MLYIHERPDWPTLRWHDDQIAQPLAAVRHRQGHLAGRMQALGFPLRSEAVLQTLTEDVLMSSAIEGEVLDRQQVRSSLARRLGMDIAGLVQTDRNVDGVVEMMLDATQHYARPLTAERLFDWHAALFPTGRSGMTRITVGAWRTDRDGPMRVVSGPIGRERVHYEAPASGRLEAEMAQFLHWFETATPDPVIKAAVAHLWFVTLHPFEDGNGRIARAIADLALARADDTAQRFYSMSAQIRIERNAYYDTLETTQKGNTDITRWLLWFIACLGRAIEGADITLAKVMRKARFWESMQGQRLNARQHKVLGRLLDGLDGKLDNRKWARLTKTSADTALRDITDLVQRGILVKDTAGGRSTRYSLIERFSS